MGTNFTAPMAGKCNHSIRIIVLYAESFYGTRRSDYDVHIIYRILLEGASIFMVLRLNCSCNSATSCLAANCATAIFLIV